MAQLSALFHRWLDVLESAKTGPGPFRCPSCDHVAVWALFVGDHASRTGAALLWCESCVHGIDVSRLHIPETAELTPFSVEPSQWPRPVPDFQRIKR